MSHLVPLLEFNLLGEKDREMRILRTIVLLNAAIELVLNEGAVEGDVTAQDSESSSPGQP